jgi:hypothetical protein
VRRHNQSSERKKDSTKTSISQKNPSKTMDNFKNQREKLRGFFFRSALQEILKAICQAEPKDVA